MTKEDFDEDIKNIKNQIDEYILISKDKFQFKKDKVVHCKGLRKLIETSPNFIKYLDEKYKEKFTRLNFFYVDNCQKPEIKVDPRKYG